MTDYSVTARHLAKFATKHLRRIELRSTYRHKYNYRCFSISSLILGQVLAFSIGGLAVPSAMAEAPFIPLENVMSSDEQARSGLNRLSPEQRAYLNEWLRQRLGASAAPTTIEPALADELTPAASADSNMALEAEIERRVAVEVAAAKAEMEAQVAQAKAEIKADDEAEQKLEPFEARITGNFRGWNGTTVFTLDNGQVWRQRHGSSYRHTSSDTRVKFDTNWLGMWEMTVVSSGRTAVVKRLD